jgi:protein-S-isoprenylcysteine O-methyltransferase Ste14
MTEPHTIVNILWIVWLLVWIIAGLRTAPTVARQSKTNRFKDRVPLTIGSVLMFLHPAWFGVLLRPLLPDAYDLALAGTILTALGLGVSIWARAHLGRLWSGSVALKSNHEVIRTGPYQATRHPIYSGVLLALLGTTLVRGTLGSLLGLILLAIGLLLRIRQEERLLLSHFGEQYRRYQRDVPAVVPRLWPRATR